MNNAEAKVRQSMANMGMTDEDVFRAQIRAVTMNEALQTLTSLDMQDAIGAAAAYLLHCAQTDPSMLRRVMNERIIPEGFSGVSLLTMLNRVCQ